MKHAYDNLEEGASIVTILATLQHPRSVGNIKLRTRDPLKPPLIDPRYLSEELDVEILADGAKLSRWQ